MLMLTFKHIKHNMLKLGCLFISDGNVKHTKHSMFDTNTQAHNAKAPNN